jgi:hypothetical protein
MCHAFFPPLQYGHLPLTQPVSNPHINSIGVKRGDCPDSLSLNERDDYVFRSKQFSILIGVRLPGEIPYDRDYSLKISTGIDLQGTAGRTIIVSGDESGEGVVCVECFIHNLPGIAQVRVELFQGNTWRDRKEMEFPVVSRDQVDAVFYPMFAHPAQRQGYPRHLDLMDRKILYLPVGIYVANGTGQQQTVGPDMSGTITYGGDSVTWNAQLPGPLAVEPYSISEASGFTLAYENNSAVANALRAEGIVLTGAASGSIPTPGRHFHETEWKTMKGIPVDVVFIGDFPQDVRQKVLKLILDRTNGYLQAAGIKLHPKPSRSFTADQIGMNASQISQFRDITDKTESAQLAAFQPPKSSPRLTIYMVEGLFAAGWVGSYAGGGSTPVDPNTPFRSPIIKLSQGKLTESKHYYQGAQYFSSLIAHELGHVFGITHTDEDRCPDTDSVQADDAFNLMFSYQASYSWILSPCQKQRIRNHPEFYRY